MTYLSSVARTALFVNWDTSAVDVVVLVVDKWFRCWIMAADLLSAGAQTLSSEPKSLIWGEEVCFTHARHFATCSIYMCNRKWCIVSWWCHTALKSRRELMALLLLSCCSLDSYKMYGECTVGGYRAHTVSKCFVLHGLKVVVIPAGGSIGTARLDRCRCSDNGRYNTPQVNVKAAFLSTAPKSLPILQPCLLCYHRPSWDSDLRVSYLLQQVFDDAHHLPLQTLVYL